MTAKLKQNWYQRYKSATTKRRLRTTEGDSKMARTDALWVENQELSAQVGTLERELETANHMIEDMQIDLDEANVGLKAVTARCRRLNARLSDAYACAEVVA